MEPDLTVEMSVPAAEAELAADDMWQAGATAVALHDEGASTRVMASFPTAAAAREVSLEMSGRGATLVEVDPGWRDVWREYARPVEVGSGLVVAPAWRDVPVGPPGSSSAGRLVLRIDPGQCFGSGSHPSSRLILAELDRDPPRASDAVLDVGCGSGILSVAAARLGAGSVTAVDIEPAAVDATRSNAAANGGADRVAASRTAVAELSGSFDLALVKVTAGVQAILAPDVVRLVRPGGRILGAGLLPGQWRHVVGAYAGATVTRRTELEGWEGVELVLA